jgi:hypothetical protein
MRRTDTPGSEWYEPADILDDDQEPEPAPIEPLVTVHQWTTWTSTD